MGFARRIGPKRVIFMNPEPVDYSMRMGALVWAWKKGLIKSEHRDRERRSFPIVCTGRILDKMFEWRAIVDSFEQSSIAFQVDIC